MNKGRAENLILASLISLVGFCSLALTVPFTSANGNPSDSLTVNIPSRCSIITTNSTAHTAQISKGIYSENIGETVAKTICNDAEGFSIYAVGYTGDTYGSTVLASDISSSNDIPTGTATSGNTSNWAMKLTAVAGDYAPTIGSDTNGSFANYHVVPSEYVKVASFNANTDDTTGGTIKTTYSAFISLNQASGNYDGKVKYTLVHPASETIQHDVTVTLDAHVSSVSFTSSGYPVQTVTNGNVGTSSTTETITLRRGVEYIITATTATGYEFASWSTSSGGTLGSTTTSPSTYIITNTATLSITSREESSFSWQPSSATKPADSEITATFQDFDSATCGLGTAGQIGWLKDSRDDQVYKIAKLADDKCWMVENLNLAGGTALSADNTDVTSVYISSFSTSNNLTKTGDTIVLPTSSTSGFSSSNYSYVYNSGNKTNCGASGQDIPCYSYYSWDAATLGSGRTLNTENTDAPHSICPKGWRLPTSGATSSEGWKRGDFYALATAYGANLESSYRDSSSATGANFYNNAGPGTIPGFLLAGYYDDSSFSYGGSYGSYWSSTSYFYTHIARHLFFASSYVRSADYLNRYYGFSVRCLFSASELYP